MTVDPGGEDAVRALLSEIAALRRAVGFRRPEDGLSCVVGVGSSLWDRLFAGPRPAGLHPLAEIAGERHKAVSTPGDLLFHLRANSLDLCFELGERITDALRGSARAVDEVHGFRSFDLRDLLGFVDGTENPEGEGATRSVVVGDEDPAHAGGSYVVVQKYLHDLDGWEALTVEQQELAIGRRKLDDVELADDEKPSNSHVVLNTIVDEQGNERQIVRQNMPFGEVGTRQFGTYFIGYARSPDVIEQMLRNMFLGVPPGNHDRILDFSKAVTGTLFFVPNAPFLEEAADEPASAASVPEAATPGGNPDGSLGLGSLRAS
jgi:putative iron-dependent peroxidase